MASNQISAFMVSYCGRSLCVGIGNENIHNLIDIFASPISLANDWKRLGRIYYFTSKGCLEPSEDEQKDSHYRIQLKGKSAKYLYDVIKAKAITDGGLCQKILLKCSVCILEKTRVMNAIF